MKLLVVTNFVFFYRFRVEVLTLLPLPPLVVLFAGERVSLVPLEMPPLRTAIRLALLVI